MFTVVLWLSGRCVGQVAVIDVAGEVMGGCLGVQAEGSGYQLGVGADGEVG